MNKKLFYALSVVFSLMVSVAIIVYAYGTNDPTFFGHSAGEVTGLVAGCPAGYSIQNITADGTVNCEQDTDTSCTGGCTITGAVTMTSNKFQITDTGGNSPAFYVSTSYGTNAIAVDAYVPTGGTGNIGVRARGGSNSYDFYAQGSGTNYGPFTGGHEVILSSEFPSQAQPGMIVSTTGKSEIRYDNETNSISLSSTLPTVKLTDKPYDRTIFGVLISETNLFENNWYRPVEGERFGIVNALGEGRVWVSNIAGNIENGDYITSSDIPGYGQKQDDDLLHSYTLGKAIESVNWDNAETIEHNSQEYKAYLIAVTYTSG